jgi:hypothetical protein
MGQWQKIFRNHAYAKCYNVPMDEKTKISAWNMDDTERRPANDPQMDEIRQSQSITAAQAAMGASMAREQLQDQQYKDDTKKFVDQSMVIDDTVPFASRAVGVDKAMGGIFAYYIACVFYWLSHPIPGLRQSRTAAIIFSASSALIAAIFLVMVYLQIIGTGSSYGRWLAHTFHSIFGF